MRKTPSQGPDWHISYANVISEFRYVDGENGKLYPYVLAFHMCGYFNDCTQRNR
jgi:hypothetical protein